MYFILFGIRSMVYLIQRYNYLVAMRDFPWLLRYWCAFLENLQDGERHQNAENRMHQNCGFINQKLYGWKCECKYGAILINKKRNSDLQRKSLGNECSINLQSLQNSQHTMKSKEEFVLWSSYIIHVQYYVLQDKMSSYEIIISCTEHFEGLKLSNSSIFSTL